jgi:hypothetical protein
MDRARLALARLVIVSGSALALAAMADAASAGKGSGRSGASGHSHSGHRSHSHAPRHYYRPAIVAAPVFLYPRPYGYYPAPVYYAPPPPPVYIEQSQDYWFFCPAVRAYYPHVTECPGGWQRVIPNESTPSSSPLG